MLLVFNRTLVKYFKEIAPDNIWNKTIIVSGILRNKKGKRTLYISHPSQLELVDDNKEREQKQIQKNQVLKRSAKIKWSLQK